MEYAKLDNKKLPKIVFGTWSWGTGVNGGKMIFGKSVEEEEIHKAYKKAVENGFILWDTAAVYGAGTAESLLAKFTGDNKDIIYSTKFMPFGLQRRSRMKKSLVGSLERLDRDSVDIFWIHRAANVRKWIEEIIPLIRKGLIKHIGLSNHTLPQIKQAKKILDIMNIPLSAIQNHYSLLYRASEKSKILEFCEKNGIVFFSYMVLEQGALTGVYSAQNPFPKMSERGLTYTKRKLRRIEPLIDKMKELANKYDVEVAAIAIAWAIGKGTIPILGITKERHLNASLQAVDLKFREKECRELEDIADSCHINVKGIWEPKISS